MGPSALKNQYPWWTLIDDLLLVLLLRAEGYLHRNSYFLLAFDLVRQVRQMRSLRNMRRETYLPVNDMSYDVSLIRAYGRNNTESSRVAPTTTIADDVDDNFLPAICTSRLAAIVTQMGNVFHDGRRNPCKWAVVFVIHGHGDE
jgi:hypothetical protein